MSPELERAVTEAMATVKESAKKTQEAKKGRRLYDSERWDDIRLRVQARGDRGDQLQSWHLASYTI